MFSGSVQIFCAAPLFQSSLDGNLLIFQHLTDLKRQLRNLGPAARASRLVTGP